MNCRILCESSGNIYRYKNVPFTCVETTIDTSTNRYYDDCGLNVSLMMEHLDSYYGEINISIPSVQDWLKAYQKADITFVLTNSSLLSSSYHNAVLAKNKCKELYPEKQIVVFNTNTTGPALSLLIDKLSFFIQEMNTLEEIVNAMQQYIPKVHVMIATLHANFLAKEKVFTSFLTKHLNLPILTNLKKHKICFSKKETLQKMIVDLRKIGFSGNRIILSHCDHQDTITELKNMLYKEFGPIQIDIQKNSGINSLYFGKEAIFLGFEQ